MSEHEGEKVPGVKMVQSPESIVRQFCAAWDRRDLPSILAMMSDDIVFQNVPRPPFRGRPATAAFLAPIINKTTAIEFRILFLSVAADGSSVLTEREDFLHFRAEVVKIPLMGIFVLRDGLIAEWRDYADGTSVAAEFERAGVSLSLPQST